MLSFITAPNFEGASLHDLSVGVTVSEDALVSDDDDAASNAKGYLTELL